MNISMAGVFSENEVKTRSLHLGSVGRADQTEVRRLIRANLRGQVWGRLEGNRRNWEGSLEDQRC